MAQLFAQRPMDDCLPAVYRDGHVLRLPWHQFDDFVKQDLSVKRIDDLRRWLWIVGRPYLPRPLNIQVVLRRSIIATEDISLHLVWTAGKIFVKPLPAYMTTHAFYDKYIAPLQVENDPTVSSPASQQHIEAQHAWSRVNGGLDDRVAARSSSRSRQEDVELNDRSGLHHRHGLRSSSLPRSSDGSRPPPPAKAGFRPALGMLYSYLAIMQTELDFALAQQAHLLPHGYTWDEWKSLSQKVLQDWPERSVFNHIPPRYLYGELRLGRLDKLYRYTKFDLLAGYSPLTGHTRYADFLAENIGMVGAAAVYVVTVLSAMQVGLATEALSQDKSFQNASFFFAVFAIVAPLVAISVIMLAFLFLFFFNWIMAHIRWTQRHTQIDLRRKH